ncbi:MAG: hypothetical protein HFACDABA_01024 [Anaerolineales bacterium]|nr:hypothetical protein [Anaerolineales bacterium]
MKTKKPTNIILIVVALFLSACGPSPEQIATMTASAWTATPSATATFTPSPTNTATPSPTLTPTITPTPTQIPLDQLEGKWSGPLEQGGAVLIEVKDGKIVYYELSFTKSGCESVTPFAVAMLSQALPIENNSFLIKGDLFGELSGTFNLEGITGALKFEFFGCVVDTTYTAAKE